VTVEEQNESLRKLMQALTWFEQRRPDLRAGYYSFPPCRDYWNATSTDPMKVQFWKDGNDALEPLAAQVKVLFPAMYTFYEDQAGWVKYARANIAEAVRMAGGKPVYPILWMEYHDSNATLKGTPLPEDFWRLQLETIRDSEASGVIIWGGWQRTWDESAPWWLATQSFIAHQ
jgi:hypothetical protein